LFKHSDAVPRAKTAKAPSPGRLTTNLSVRHFRQARHNLYRLLVRAGETTERPREEGV